jgi:MinD-like ATPase involved in chromosome partitioning or flagellar assembly
VRLDLYVITFYSFKGGVGRTMALVNVAAELARRGRQILVADFDLEAPGLETYALLKPPKPHPGIVEFVTEYRRTRAVPDLREFVYETKPIGKKGGRLWVMPAGRRDDAYRRALVQLDWKRLYDQEDGFLLFEEAKAGWEQEFKPDYVLIDSRTGDTDVRGICTRQLPDSVVIMFTPNQQNLAGLEHVVDDIRREETEGLKKMIRMHFVAANVPDLDDEYRVLRRQLHAFQERLKFEKLSATLLRLENLRLLDQSVVVLNRRRSKLARSYRRLVPILMADNLKDRDGALAYLNRHAHYRQELRRNWGVPGWKDLYLELSENWSVPRSKALHTIASEFIDDPEILFGVAEWRINAEEFEEGKKTLDRVLSLRPDFGEALEQRAVCYARLNQPERAAADLVDYLRLPNHEPRAVVRAFRELRVLSPTQLVQVARLPKLAAIPFHTRIELADILVETDKGLDAALNLLADYVLEETPLGLNLAILYSEFLIRTRQWHKAMAVIDEANEYRKPNVPELLFMRALASWGETDRLSQTECKRILHYCDETCQDLGDLRELKAWLLWGSGEPMEAIKALDGVLLLDASGRAGEPPPLFSYWRMRSVWSKDYRADCAQLRRMFEGEPLRPAFLGSPTS